MKTSSGNLSNVVNNEVVKKKTTYQNLFAKVDVLDSSRFALKNKYDTDRFRKENTWYWWTC